MVRDPKTREAGSKGYPGSKSVAFPGSCQVDERKGDRIEVSRSALQTADGTAGMGY